MGIPRAAKNGLIPTLIRQPFIFPSKPNRVSQMTHKYYSVNVPVEGKDGKTRFRRVGAAFPNKDGAKSFMSIKLDFPVGATELVLFEPKEHDEDDQ
jgi:hypothetical protein